MHAGSGRNIIPNNATLKVETRGETSEINDYAKRRVRSIISGAAEMYELEFDIETVGEGKSCHCSMELAHVMDECARSHDEIEKSTLESSKTTGSEDATFFMEKVQQNGGQATYCVFGTELAAGHHNEKFDINEDTLLPAVEILYQSAVKLGNC